MKVFILFVLNIFLFLNVIKSREFKADETNITKVYLWGLSNVISINLYVGSPVSQPKTLIFDTHRNYTALVSDLCKTCGDVIPYDPKKSQSFSLESDNFSLEMYKNTFIGRLGRDIISIMGTDFIFNRSEIVLVDEIKNGESFNFQGYMGLGFTSSQENGILYKMKSAGKIKKAIYSFLVSIDSSSAELHLGGYDANLINSTDFSKIIWTNVSYTSEDSFTNWYIPTGNVYLNDNLTSTGHKLILSSASNLIRLPSKFFFDNLSKIFDKKSQCQILKNSLFRCKCNNDYATVFPTFKFTFDKNQNITISPNDYISLDNSGVQNVDSSAYCVLFLSPNYENDYWILGLNFMNDYYTIFDMENSQVGLYSIKYFSSEGLESILYLSMIIIVSSILFFSVLFCIYKRMTNRQNNIQPLVEDY